MKPAEFFVVNLAISDLGMTISLFPLAIPSAFTHMWLFNKTICTGYAFCGVLFGLCSLTNLTVLSSVCWLKVCCPNYGNKFSYCHASMLVAGVWCYAGVFAVGPLSGWGEYGPEPYGTACCINWEAPGRSFAAMSYIICLFFFCYIVPSTVIFLSYTFILMTVRGSRQAVPAIAFAWAAIFAKSSTLYNPIVYLFFKPNFRRSLCRDVALCKSTLCGCQHSSPSKGPCSQFNHKEECNSTQFSNGLPENHGTTCRHCACPEAVTGARENLTEYIPQQTFRILKGSIHSEVAESQLSNDLQSDFL
ncbi:hypothetical protein F7725_000829 [Dissostichus mawsoni]|uniref:G-protein coupled receptors family 1 profile domain-containing protein n=1 Tax=Dissostichus mawsoni TaxID=36200 RepID=A0A7J5ZFI6_DISMA|nr:hypothetical protein F7725_000829 [Dissostichus mawsoni]